MRTLHIFNALLAATLIGFSIAVYPGLPEQIPTHFNARGEADAWSDKSLLAWLLLPLIGVGSVVLIYVLGAYAPRRPGIVNVPDRKRYQAMPPEYQRIVVRGVMNSTYILNAGLLVMFTLLQYGAWEVAMGRSGRISIMGGILFGLVSIPMFTVIIFVMTQRAMDDAWRRYKSDTAAPAA